MEKGKIRNPAAVLVFSIITCGIYALYWIYSFANELKNYLGKTEISPGLELFLCIICFPYALYWLYRYGEYMKEAQIKAGVTVDNDLPILFLILGLFGLFVVSMMIMQMKVNAVYSK
jgi:hypothetical protein